MPQCREDCAQDPEDRTENPGKERNVAGEQDEDDETQICRADKDQVEPVAEGIIPPVEADRHNNGEESEKQQVPRSLVDLTLHKPRLERSAQLEFVIGGDDVQQTPNYIRTGSDSGRHHDSAPLWK